jgi:hypothetical protein
MLLSYDSEIKSLSLKNYPSKISFSLASNSFLSFLGVQFLRVEFLNVVPDAVLFYVFPYYFLHVTVVDKHLPPCPTFTVITRKSFLCT